MKVSLGTIEVSDESRLALNAHYGRAGLATRDDVRDYVMRVVDAAFESVQDEWAQQSWIAE